MFGLSLLLNFFAVAALFSNHRLASLLCFYAYTLLNIFFLFQAEPSDLDPTFFVIIALSTLAVFTALTSQSRDQVLTHQKKRASLHLVAWSVLISIFFGHWLLTIFSSQGSVDKEMNKISLEGGETFIMLAIIVLWMVGKDLYDRK